MFCTPPGGRGEMPSPLASVATPAEHCVESLSTCQRGQNRETSKSAPESALGSTFGGFPVLPSLAGRQTLKHCGHFFLQLLGGEKLLEKCQ